MDPKSIGSMNPFTGHSASKSMSDFFELLGVPVLAPAFVRVPFAEAPLGLAASAARREDAAGAPAFLLVATVSVARICFFTPQSSTTEAK